MDFKYPKADKLKSKKTIDSLFSKGKSVARFPLRLVFVESDYGLDLSTNQKLKIGVSVSKKNFKKAVDRNYFKRLLREAYRLNKYILVDNLEKPMAMMLFYQTKERLTFQEINEKTVQLFEKFLEQTSNDNHCKAVDL
ncbi:MAG: ribonuclease protein component [Bacteroidota bacterium]|jgi:ribonuclease P protein component